MHILPFLVWYPGPSQKTNFEHLCKFYFNRYIAWTGDYELAAKDEEENIEQRYQRLNCEVRQLLDDLDQMKVSGTEKVGNQSLVGLVKLTGMLQDQLSGMKLEDFLGSDGVQDIKDPSGSMKKKLIKQLESLKSDSKPKENSIKSTDSDDVMYELMMKPESSKLDERQRLAVFEQRLEALEKVLGPTQDKLVRN